MRMRKIDRILAILLMIVLLGSNEVYATQVMSPENTVQTAAEVATKTVLNGWVKKGNKTYYYIDGIAQTGWQKVKHNYYYMNGEGVLLKNQIAGNKKDGYYYVDMNGVRVTEDAIRYAVKFVRANTKSGWSKEKKLKACFAALANTRSYKYQRFHVKGQPKAKDMSGYAVYMLKKKQGNCYRYGAAYACIARVLGYDSRVNVGWITSTSGGRTFHGWTEVKIDGRWYICDANMQTHSRVSYMYYKQKTHPCKVWVDHRYTLKVSGGKVKWK